MDRNLFFEDAHQAFYTKNGYLYISNFLDSAAVQEMLDAYYKYEFSSRANGFHRTLDLIDIEQKKKITAAIHAVVTPIAKQHLIDYRFLLTSFMTKEKGADDFDIHQNWCFVDEKIFTSLVIWIPLQDVDETNGTMYFIPGSDKWNNKIRGNNIEWQYGNEKQSLQNQLIPVNMKAGDAVIFDDATIHYTSANKSNNPRISIAQVMIPNEAQPVFYNYNPKTKLIEQYAIDKNFYLEFTNRYMNNKGFSDVELLKTMKV